MGNINVMGGGFDLRKYTPRSVLSNATLTSTYQTLLNIAGEGFLNHAAVFTNTGATAASRAFMKITVDDVILFEGTAKNLASVLSFTGFMDTSKLISRSGTNESVIMYPYNNVLSQVIISDANIPTARNLPYTGAQEGILYADSPLFFKTSLKIECKVATTSVACNALITYGVKV